ncbi:hypothetical protein DL770_001046 [Monosporascus sp. CRB-9-2]|nr:hypothetical protein DL770_001046 [Monosporascus sp. CRB-9-2]
MVDYAGSFTYQEMIRPWRGPMLEVPWNKAAFNNLVIDDETKLVQALITDQLEATKATDLIENKGNGLVMLLREVILEQRSLNDLKPDALFSVFLPVPVYRDGILVAASNRAGTFADAFKARMQLVLHYEKLDRGQRTQCYVSELAEYAINGREIRNSITTTRKLG